jgi:inosine-uridine nucleoside N-ribohydrolase
MVNVNHTGYFFEKAFRAFCCAVAVLFFSWLFMTRDFVEAANNQPETKKIPVILDTDIGDDIDDTWALGVLLNSPEVDIKLITTSTTNTLNKARIVAKMLMAANRTDIPIGIGVPMGDTLLQQSGWMKDFKLSSYPGPVVYDGVGRLIDTIMSSPEPVTLIAIGPLYNIGEALERKPQIAEKVNFVGMLGSIYKGYGDSPKIAPEHNVKTFVQASQKVFKAPWKSMVITPLDTCGIIRLKEEKYKTVLQSENPIAKAVIDSYRAWSKHPCYQANSRGNPDIESSELFDTVAVYLAITTDLVKIEKLPIIVDGQGYTIIKDGGSMVNCAVEWKDLPAYENWLVERVTGKVTK